MGSVSSASFPHTGTCISTDCAHRGTLAGECIARLPDAEDDVAARHLYEAMGLRRTEGDGGPLMFVYEMDLG